MTDIETSNSQDPVHVTGADAASTAEHVQDSNAEHGTPHANAPSEGPPSLADKMKAQAHKAGDDNAQANAPAKDGSGPKADDKGGGEGPGDPPPAPKFTPNYKYKAFGKEKELDPFFRDLVKDAESEKKVKEVFTRADAFDDMKNRYDESSRVGQETLQRFTALDRDVKRVTSFLNNGDTDNFFRSLGITDQQLLEHLEKKAEISRLSPQQQQAYDQGVNARAQALYQQESMEQLKNNYANQQMEYRQMQLDSVLLRPEVNSAASTWDQKMGLGSFRQLVIEEGANVNHSTGQDLPAEVVVQRVLQKFGKLIESSAPQQPQANHNPQPQNVPPQAPQGPQTVVVQGKPVIPNVNGRGTSPVKQAPKSLDDLRKMGQAARMADAQFQEANI